LSVVSRQINGVELFTGGSGRGAMDLTPDANKNAVSWRCRRQYISTFFGFIRQPYDRSAEL